MIVALQSAMIAFAIAMMACGIVAGVGYGFAAAMQAYSAHKIAMRLIDLGQVPPPRERITLFGFLLRRPRDDSPAELILSASSKSAAHGEPG